MCTSTLPQPQTYHIEIRGLDIYDPISDMVKARSVADIAYWEMDSDYNGTHFVVSSLHFCGGEKKEFEAWRKGLGSMATSLEKRKKERKSNPRKGMTMMERMQAMAEAQRQMQAQQNSQRTKK